MADAKLKEISDHRASATDAAPWQALEQVERELARLAAEHPDAMVQDIADELARLERRLGETRAALEAAAARIGDQRREHQLEGVVETLLPASIPSPAAVWHTQRSAEARLALLREYGAWSATEVAERAGSTAANRSALASAWRAAGRALAVDWHGRTVFPAFQFTDDGQPRPAIAAVLPHLHRAGLSDWQAALWFTSPTGWLDEQRPVDLLDSDPTGVETAAAQFDQRPT
jgi:hypothetical protein